jgi:hypothetical protein
MVRTKIRKLIGDNAGVHIGTLCRYCRVWSHSPISPHTVDSVTQGVRGQSFPLLSAGMRISVMVSGSSRERSKVVPGDHAALRVLILAARCRDRVQNLTVAGKHKVCDALRVAPAGRKRAYPGAIGRTYIFVHVPPIPGLRRLRRVPAQEVDQGSPFRKLQDKGYFPGAPG